MAGFNGINGKVADANYFNSFNKKSSSESTMGDYSGSTLYKGRGPAEFDINKYNISHHSYPSDLMGPVGEYGGNYVIFYINVAVDSKLLLKSDY